MTDTDKIAEFMRTKGVQRLPEGDGKTTLGGFQRALERDHLEDIEQAAEQRAQRGFEQALTRKGVR